MGKKSAQRFLEIFFDSEHRLIFSEGASENLIRNVVELSRLGVNSVKVLD